MKYFIDTEFIEGFHKPLFGRKRHFVDLISIGIVCEDGRTYSAISNEYKFKNADKWVKENVIIPLYKDTVHGDARNHCQADNFQYIFGKLNKQIAAEIMAFVWHEAWSEWIDSSDEFFERGRKYGWNLEPIEFYGYYSDYDWVLFCSLFGRMIDLPKGFPMYCNDLKQMLDEKAKGITQLELTKTLYHGTNWEVVSELPKSVHSIDDYTLPMKIELLKTIPGYPKQTNEHNALADAKWNFQIYKFLKTI